jgi:hypothetical protein
MSQDLSSNPYQFNSPNPNAYQPKGDGKLKPFTKAIFIIYLVLGILGIVGSIIGIVSIALLPMIQKMMDDAGANQQIDMNPFPGAAILTIAMTLFSGALSIGMVWGGISGLNRKLSGLDMTRWVSVALIVYKLIEMPFNMVVQYFSFQVQKENMREQMQEQMANNPNMPDIASITEIAFFVGIGIGVLIGIGIMIFYAICYMHLSKADVRANFK